MDPVELDDLRDNAFHFKDQRDDARKQALNADKKLYAEKQKNASLQQQLTILEQQNASLEQHLDAEKRRADTLQENLVSEKKENCKTLLEEMFKALEEKILSIEEVRISIIFASLKKDVFKHLLMEELFVIAEGNLWKCIAIKEKLDQLKELLKLIPAMLPFKNVEQNFFDAIRSENPLVKDFLKKFTFKLIQKLDRPSCNLFKILQGVFEHLKVNFQEMETSSTGLLKKKPKSVWVLFKNGDEFLIVKETRGGHRVSKRKYSDLKEPKPRESSNLKSPSFGGSLLNSFRRMTFSKKNKGVSSTESFFKLNESSAKPIDIADAHMRLNSDSFIFT